MLHYFHAFITFLAFLFWGGQSVQANDPDPGTVKALRAMHANLVAAREQELVTRYQASDATLGTSYRGTAHFIVRQPNLLRLSATTSKGSVVIVSDG